MNLDSFTTLFLPEIEESLKTMLDKSISLDFSGMKEMMSYHMGWDPKKNLSNGKGKRIRPIILLLCSKLCGVDWRNALPAAVALEYLHNFSLIHDDIEDQSDFRHGQLTIWKKWGIAQAINTGDAMFSLSQLAILDLGKTNPNIVYQAARLFNSTCLALTGGQHLDMLFESKTSISSDEYFQMISGKTAALIAASTELGGIIAETSESDQINLRAFGTALGIAFQAQDDYLGIWGDEKTTGKSTSLDLKTGKKTLPVVFVLEKNSDLQNVFGKLPENDEEISERVEILEKNGAKDYIQDVTLRYSNLAKQSLNYVNYKDEDAYLSLNDLLNKLLRREK
jgi:geranylgeranyl diphosphate synthase type I